MGRCGYKEASPCLPFDRKSRNFLPTLRASAASGAVPGLRDLHGRTRGYTAKIDITSAGHVVTWRYAGLTLTEVAASAQHPLPKMRRLLSYGLKGQRSDRVECRGGVSYQMSFQLEPAEPEVFWTFQEELAGQGQRQGMLHRFDSSGRMALGALSYINVEARNRSLLVQAFHTFPDDYAIVKSQSLFRTP